MKQDTGKEHTLGPTLGGAIGPGRFATVHGGDKPGLAVWSLPVTKNSTPQWTDLSPLLGGPAVVALSPKGDIAAGTRHAADVMIIDAAAKRVRLKGPTAGTRALAWSGDGAWLAAGGTNAATPPTNSPSTKRVTYHSGGVIMLWSTKQVQAKPVTLTGADTELEGLAFSPDSAKIAAIFKDGTVIVWDVTSGAERARKRFAGRGHTLSYGLGTMLAVARTADDSGFTVDVLDATSLTVRATHKTQSHWPTSLAWSKDDASLAAVGKDAVYVFAADQSDAKPVRLSYAGGDDPPVVAAFVSSGLLVLGGSNKTWTLWNAKAGTPTSSMP